MKKLIIFFLFLIFSDQFLKHIVRHYDFINGGFYICNTGVSFGFILPKILLIVIYFIIFTILTFSLFYYFKLRQKIDFIALALILSGAAGNLIDRIFLGCVIDFLQISFWPMFNLADIFIAIGAIIFLASNFFAKK